MSPPAPERFLHGASLTTLTLTAFAAGIATVLHWLEPVRQPMDLVIPPVTCVLFLVLLFVLVRQPQRVGAIMRIALLAGLLALAAPAWYYTWQATADAALPLIDIYPPVAPLLLALMVATMIYLPPRQAVVVVVACWLLVALPVLLYLLAHPAEMRTPRGADLLMAYGPVFVLLVVLLPVQREVAIRIQRLMAEQARMEAMANRDPLTRLHNRRYAEQRLHDLLEKGAAGGVIMFDMDRFKAINDTHGHPVGDRVLQHVAQRCQRMMRRDECLARWGGEEFLVVVPQIDAHGLQSMAERLRVAIAELDVAPVPQVNASLGLAMVTPGDDFDSLLQRADQALYRAKQQGRNQVAW